MLGCQAEVDENTWLLKTLHTLVARYREIKVGFLIFDNPLLELSFCPTLFSGAQWTIYWNFLCPVRWVMHPCFISTRFWRSFLIPLFKRSSAGFSFSLTLCFGIYIVVKSIDSLILHRLASGRSDQSSQSRDALSPFPLCGVEGNCRVCLLGLHWVRGWGRKQCLSDKPSPLSPFPPGPIIALKLVRKVTFLWGPLHMKCTDQHFHSKVEFESLDIPLACFELNGKRLSVPHQPTGCYLHPLSFLPVRVFWSHQISRGSQQKSVFLEPLWKIWDTRESINSLTPQDNGSCRSSSTCKVLSQQSLTGVS